MELLRNGSHGSEIITLMAGDSADAKKIIKASSTPEGMRCLSAELAGWDWYQKRRYPKRKTPVCRVIQQNGRYMKVEIEYIQGHKGEAWKGLENNAAVVLSALRHYQKVWPGQGDEKAPFHGDLSVDNIITNSDGTHFIDWEHFRAEAAPWGFDGLYLIFETLWFGMRTRQMPAEAEIRTVIAGINSLNSEGRLSSRMVRSPLRAVREFIKENIGLWGGQLQRFPDKLPVHMFSEEQTEIIDQMTSRGMN